MKCMVCELFVNKAVYIERTQYYVYFITIKIFFNLKSVSYLTNKIIKENCKQRLPPNS